eukprot:gene13350-17906_t
MDRLDKLASYFNEKERKRLQNKAKDSYDGLPEMTLDEVRLSCMENNGYETPELNDKLYLHFRGFKKIANLELYTGCKSIWLDSNGFSRIEGLDAMAELRCLYLSKNLIFEIGDGLKNLTNLVILDLSNNRLTKIDNLANSVPQLQTINLSHNALNSIESIEHFKECPSITNIDVTNNRLESNEQFFDLFSQIPSLVTLSINGNDITKLVSFRKKMIAKLPKLGYLDRPIDESERRFAVAFVNEGMEGETKARALWKEEQTNKRIREMNEFKEWQAEQFKIREQARMEGKSLITEFTKEEQEEREREAKEASEAEKKVLELGIGKLANKYWQLEGQNIKGDALDEASRLLLLEQSKNNNPMEEENPASDVNVLKSNDMNLNDNNNEESVSASDAITLHDIDVAMDEFESIPAPPQDQNSLVKEKDNTNNVVTNDDPIISTATIDTIPDDTHNTTKANGEIDEQDTEEEKQARMARVDESMRLYKKQLARERAMENKKNNNNKYNNNDGNKTDEEEDSDTGGHGFMKSSTWSGGSVISGSSNAVDVNRPLYWSETMDMILAQQVKLCVFDFDEICDKMRIMAEKNELDSQVLFKNSNLLTSDVCRIRWSQLDAKLWCDVTPDSSALDTIFRVCISPAVLGAGHGAQPSFQSLKSMASSSVPTYLKPPTAFPSVQDVVMDDDADNELDLD